MFKLRSTRTFYALLGSALAVVLLPTIPICAFADFGTGDGPLEVLLFLIGRLTQVFALMIGVLAVTTEFRHGTITPTLLVVPNRVRLMAAKLAAALSIGAAIGIVSTGLIIAIVALFGSARDFDTSGDKLAMFIGGTLTAALFAALGMGLGALLRNQVGAIVAPLVYIFLLEPLIGGLMSLSDALDEIMPKYSLGAVSKSLSHVNPDDERLLLGQVSGGLLLALYVVILLVAGTLLMQRRDVTA
jgi:ABC-2 type transport system permease protein